MYNLLIALGAVFPVLLNTYAGVRQTDLIYMRAAAMLGARGCVSYDSTTLTYTVVVTWQGMSDTFAPVVNCANNLYGAETKRRAVWTTLKIATLS